MLPQSTKFIFSLLLLTILNLVHQQVHAENYIAVEPKDLNLVVGPNNPLQLKYLMNPIWKTIIFKASSDGSLSPTTFTLIQVVQKLKSILVVAQTELEIDLLEKLEKINNQAERTRIISLFVLMVTVFFIVILVVIVGLFVHLLKS
jgi:hypothetical protein